MVKIDTCTRLTHRFSIPSGKGQHGKNGKNRKFLHRYFTNFTAFTFYQYSREVVYVG